MTAVALLMVLGILASAGCGSSPSAPSPASAPPPAAAPPPAVAGSTALLAIEAIDPQTGTTGGSTTVKITGAGFRSGTTVTFGGERRNASVVNSTTLYVTTPVHAAATVDVILTRPDGETATLTSAFTYAAPQSFNFNGTWSGYALAHPEFTARYTAFHSDMEMGFTIQDNVLTSFTCGGSAIFPPSPPSPVTDGEFSLISLIGDGFEISGRIVSADEAIGTISTLACQATRWTATRR